MTSPDFPGPHHVRNIITRLTGDYMPEPKTPSKEEEDATATEEKSDALETSNSKDEAMEDDDDTNGGDKGATHEAIAAPVLLKSLSVSLRRDCEALWNQRERVGVLRGVLQRRGRGSE